MGDSERKDSSSSHISIALFGLGLVGLVIAWLFSDNMMLGIASLLALFQEINLLSLAVFGLTVFAVGWLICASVVRTIGAQLAHANPVTRYLGDVAPEEQQRREDWLHGVYDKRGIATLWNDAAKQGPLKILLTGATGYVGSSLLFELLTTIKQDKTSNAKKHKIVLLIRAKKARRRDANAVSIQDRGAKLREDPMYEELLDVWDNCVELAEAGDNLAIAADTEKELEKKGITHIIHCVADVNFVRELPIAASTNILPSLALQKLAEQWKTCQRMVYVSTAFVNPGTGAPDAPMEEQIIDLKDYDPEELYQSMLGDQKLALECMDKLGFVNTYVFTKCVGEHLLEKHQNTTPVHMVRPAIVGPAWMTPWPGWNGEKPSTVTASGTALRARIFKFSNSSDFPFPVIPVDLVTNGIIHSLVIADDEKNKLESKARSAGKQLFIRNIIWAHDGPIPIMHSRQVEYLTLHLWVLTGTLSTPACVYSVALMRFVNRFPALFEVCNEIFNRGPLYLLDWIQRTGKVVGLSIVPKIPAGKLLSATKLMDVFKFFLRNHFFFESSIHIDGEVSQHQYVFDGMKAVELFKNKVEKMAHRPKTAEGQTNNGTDATAAAPSKPPHPKQVMDSYFNETNLVVKKRDDLWWAMTQPRGTLPTRLVVYVTAKVLRACDTSVTLDLKSVAHVAKAVCTEEEAAAGGCSKKCLLVVPSAPSTSIVDVALVILLFFASAGMGLAIPRIVTVGGDKKSSEFEDIGVIMLIIRWLLSIVGVGTSKNAAVKDAVPSKLPNDDALIFYLNKGAASAGLARELKAAAPKGSEVIPITIDHGAAKDHGNDTEFSSSLLFTSILGWCLSVLVLGNDKNKVHDGDIRLSFGSPVEG